MRRTRLTVAVALAASVVVVGLPATVSAAPRTPAPAADLAVQLLAMNDVHGRISETTGTDAILSTGPGGDGRWGTVDDPGPIVGGAEHIAGTVDQAQAAFVAQGGTDQASLFVGAGDLVSASPFNSSAFKDEPTIEALNAMGLDVSAVGNHEFDRGTQELRRISAATDGAHTDDVTACQGVQVGVTGCFGTGKHAFQGAEFPFLAANVVSSRTGKPMLPPYQVFDVGGGKKVALIGVVTETTPTIVAAAGIQDVKFLDEAEAVNRYVPELQRKGIQAIGVLVHEGGVNDGADLRDWDGCDTLSGPVVDINNAVVPAVDLIISAHSHQAYNCRLTDPAGQPRLVTQAGFYGRLVSDIRLTLDAKTGDVKRWCAPYQADNVEVTRDHLDGTVAAIVDYWEGRAAETGNRVVGTLTAPASRAYDGTAENRGAESPLGNLVAQAQLEAAAADPALASGGLTPVVAFMNPGGLRADIDAGPVTYAEAFAVQPFSNTVNAITLTGRDIRGVLEQQFQADAAGPRNTPLVLGTSNDLKYTYDLGRAYGDRVDPASITIGGVPVVATQQYRVVANSFLIAGGDSFTSFTKGVNPATGPMDVDTSVAYFQKYGTVTPPAADHGTVVTGSTWAADKIDLPAGQQTTVTKVDATPGLPSPVCDATAAMTPGEPKRGDRVTATGTRFAAGEKVTAVLVDGSRTLGSAVADGQGTVSIGFDVPRDLAAGKHQVRLTGASGEPATTEFTLKPVQVEVRDTIKETVQAFVQRLIAWLFRR